MDKLDQLITKFKEAKEELEKAGVAPAPSSIIADDQMRAKALGEPTNPNAPVAKEEEKDDMEKGLISDMAAKMKGGGNTQLTKPSEPGRANFYTEAMHGAYQPKAAAPAAPVKSTTSTTKLTGLDRVKAAANQPIKKDEGGEVKPKPSVSALTTTMPKLKEGFRAHPGAFSRPTAAAPTVSHHLPTGTGNAVRGTAEPTQNVRPPTASGTTQGAIRGTSEETKPSVSAPKKDLHADLSSRVRAMQGKDGHNKLHGLVRKEEEGPKFEKTVNMSTNPAANDMTKGCNEKLALNKGGQWDIKKDEN